MKLYFTEKDGTKTYVSWEDFSRISAPIVQEEVDRRVLEKLRTLLSKPLPYIKI